MAVYTIENTAKVKKPVKVFDATGMEVLYCTMADDETGEIERLCINEDGSYVLDARGERVMRVSEVKALPLIIEVI